MDTNNWNGNAATDQPQYNSFLEKIKNHLILRSCGQERKTHGKTCKLKI